MSPHVERSLIFSRRAEEAQYARYDAHRHGSTTDTTDGNCDYCIQLHLGRLFWMYSTYHERGDEGADPTTLHRSIATSLNIASFARTSSGVTPGPRAPTCFRHLERCPGSLMYGERYWSNAPPSISRRKRAKGAGYVSFRHLQVCFVQKTRAINH